MFRRIVNVVEYVALGGAVVAVALLLFYEPSGRGTYNPAAAAGSGATAPDGAAVFVAHCSGCHGSKGEGGIGPKLAGGAVAKKYPNEADEIGVVTSGRGSMPAWQGTLSPAEIAAVVAYTRTGLG